MSKIFLLVITLVFFFFVSLITIKGEKKDFPVRCFSLAALVLSFFFLAHVLWFKFEIIRSYPFLIRTFSPLMFLPAPLTYIGVKQLINRDFKVKRSHLIHFLPAILQVIESIPFYLLPFNEKKVIAELVLSENLGWMIYPQGLLPSILVDCFRFLLMLLYFSISLKLVLANQVLEKYSKTSSESSWIKPTLIFFGFVYFILIFQYFLNLIYYFFHIYLDGIRNAIIVFIILGIVFYIRFLLLNLKIKLGFRGLENKEKFVFQSSIGDSIRAEENSLEVSAKVRLSPIELSEAKEKLEVLFKEDKIYLNQNLTVKELAELVGVSARHLPEIFSELYNTTFKDFLNSYRIEYAKEKIRENYLISSTVDSLALDSGFNSRITLYKVFKKEMNLSPTEYWVQVKGKL